MSTYSILNTDLRVMIYRNLLWCQERHIPDIGTILEIPSYTVIIGIILYCIGRVGRELLFMYQCARYYAKYFAFCCPVKSSQPSEIGVIISTYVTLVGFKIKKGREHKCNLWGKLAELLFAVIEQVISMKILLITCASLHMRLIPMEKKGNEG